MSVGLNNPCMERESLAGVVTSWGRRIEMTGDTVQLTQSDPSPPNSTLWSSLSDVSYLLY